MMEESTGEVEPMEVEMLEDPEVPFQGMVALAESLITQKLDDFPENMDDSMYFSSNNLKNGEKTFEEKKKGMHKLCSFLMKDELNEIKDKNKLLSRILILIGEHWDGKYNDWSNEELGKMASNMSRLLNAGTSYGWESNIDKPLQTFLIENFEECSSPRKSAFGQVMAFFKSRITKDNFKYFPATSVAFEFLLRQVQYPFLSSFLDNCAAASLIILDDYYDQNKITGARCLRHVVESVTKGELMRNNLGQVIFEALSKMIIEKDSQVIDEVVPAVLVTLKTIEKDPHENSDQMTLYDEALSQVLCSMELIAEGDTRIEWLRHLRSFMRVMKTAILHSVSRINGVLKQFSYSLKVDVLYEIVEVIKLAISNTWIKPCSREFSEILLMVLINSVLSELWSEGERTAIQCKVEEAFLLMAPLDDYEDLKTNIFINMLTEKEAGSKSTFDPRFLEILEKIYNAVKAKRDNPEIVIPKCELAPEYEL